MKESSKILIGMSHEMRTYMNSIVGNSYLIESTYINGSEGDTFSTKIHNSCNQLLWLFESYLDSAMLDNGNSNVVLKGCRISNIFSDLISGLRETLSQHNSEIVLTTEYLSSDPTEFIIDAPKITRAIQCIFQNAVNNMKSGYIKIGYTYSNDKVTFYILDSDQDWSKSKEFLLTNDMDKSLTKFFDATSAINITLAKKIIQLLGGTISVFCHETSGTGFYLTVPAKVIEKPTKSNNEGISSKYDCVMAINYRL